MFYGLLSHRMPFPDLCPAHSPGAGAGGDFGIHYARAEAHFRRGCSHCVKVAERWLAPALKVLNREGLGPKRVFLQNEEGSYSEVTV